MAVIQEAPPTFWLTVEQLVEAAVTDVWSVIEWVL